MSNAISTLAFIKAMSAGGGGGEAESHMFLATYGTTTAAEVGAAYHANKVCYVLNTSEENLGVIVEENNTHYTFGCPKAKGTLLMSVNKTTNQWSTNFYSHYAVGGNGISVVHGEGTGTTGNEETISAKVDGTTIGFDADGKLKTIGGSGDVFIATYGETTKQELLNAWNANKIMYVTPSNDSSIKCVCLNYDENMDMFMFSNIQKSNFLPTNDLWINAIVAYTNDDGEFVWDDSQSIKVPGIIWSKVVFASCSTAGVTQNKTITINNYTEHQGDLIAITFANANSVNTPKLSINGGTARNMQTLTGTNISSGYWRLFETILFYYTGSYYIALKGAEATTLYPGIVKLNSTLTSAATNQAATASTVKTLNESKQNILSPNNGIEIADNIIMAKVDGTTIGFDADGKLKTIGSSSDDTFIAEYNVTTIEQLVEAYNAGKVIACKIDDSDAKLKRKSNDSEYYIMTYLDYYSIPKEGIKYFEFSSVDSEGCLYTTYINTEISPAWGEVTYIDLTEGGSGSGYTAGPGIDISDDEDKEISVKIDGTTISLNNQDELVVVGGGGGSSEEVIIEGEEYFSKATQHEKNNDNIVIGYYNYEEGGYTEYDFTYQMMHVTDFSGSITDGLITLGHCQMWNNYHITMTGTIVSDLTVSIDTKRKFVFDEADGCYEITWSGKDASGKIIGNSVCICGYSGDDNMISDIKITADGVNFINATVKGTIKASK